jgi:citrate synthase
MPDMHTEEDLKAVIAENLHIPVTEVSETLEYSTVRQWDSLAHVSLILGLESTFGVSIDDDRVVELTNYRAIRDFILGQRA